MKDRERSSIAPSVVLSFLAASLVLSLAFGYFVYVRYIRYTPHASAYLPKDASATLWLDVEQGVVYEPFRRHFLALLETGRPGLEPRLLRFERQTTIELGVDTRELALAWGPGDRFSAALGGMFRRDGVVQGAVRMLLEEGLPAALGPNESFAKLGSQAFFSAEADGVLLLSATPPGLEPPRESLVPRPGVALILCWGAASGSKPCIDVETEADFPFRLRGAPAAAWPVVLDAGLASGSLEGLATPSDGSGKGLPQVREMGSLGRAGFDALLAALADSFARQSGPGFDRTPSAR